MRACCIVTVASSSLQTYGLQPTRLLFPWDSPGMNTGVDYHFLLQGISWPRNQTHICFISCIEGGFFTHWATWEALIGAFSSVQFSSVQSLSHFQLCDPMNRSTPGLPVHHHLLEFTQTRVHWVGDAIQPSHPLLSPFSPAFNFSQHQGLFQWVSSSHQVAKVLDFELQYHEYSGLISFRID